MLRGCVARAALSALLAHPGHYPLLRPSRCLHSITQKALAGKRFDPAAAVGATSSRVHPTSARSRRQQRRTSGATSSSTTTGRQQQQQQQQSTTSKSASSSAAASRNTTGATRPQSSGSARGAQQIGRFNRITAQKGLAFASYLYVIGESMTLAVTALLHTDTLHVGEVGSWLTALGAGGFVDGYLERGPTILGIRLSPRLLLNYLVANVCTYPLYRYQYAFCAATAPAIGRATAPLRRRLRESRKAKSAIPKAPSPDPSA